MVFRINKVRQETANLVLMEITAGQTPRGEGTRIRVLVIRKSTDGLDMAQVFKVVYVYGLDCSLQNSLLVGCYCDKSQSGYVASNEADFPAAQAAMLQQVELHTI